MNAPSYRAPISVGQYERHCVKSDQARRGGRRHYYPYRGTGASMRRFKYWQNALHKLGKCHYRGCRCRPVNDYWLPDSAGSLVMLCHQHAPLAGFCVVCSSFVAGIDDMELMDTGMCSECAREHRGDREQRACTASLHDES